MRTKEYFYSSTYMVTEETERIRPLLAAARAYHENQPEFFIPYSWWMDQKGWLYVRWEIKGELDRVVYRYRFDSTASLVVEKIPVNVKKADLLRGKGSDAPVVLITGDTHRDFTRVETFCRRFPTTKDDVMIILGDAGINFCGDPKDAHLKERLSKLNITLFCIHGNHEMRPESIGTYREMEWRGGTVYVEESFPSLLFAKDGEIYDIAGQKTLVIGGAYSVDKHYRLSRGWSWFADEQPSEETWMRVKKQLVANDWKVNVVLSHTVPYRFRPVDTFIQGLDQSTVDTSTEETLGHIEKKLTYKKWYAGHFHIDREAENCRIMYKQVALFMQDRDLNFQMR